MTNCLGPRKFLHSGKLYKAKSNKELYGFLFNDFLLLTQITKPLGSSGTDKVFSPKSNLQYKMYKTVRFSLGRRKRSLQRSPFLKVWWRQPRGGSRTGEEPGRVRGGAKVVRGGARIE